jgi:hypothetical protein
MLAALRRVDAPAPRTAAEGTPVGAGAASGELPDGEGGGDPAMEAAPDPDVERADALCGPQGDGTPDADGEEHLPRVDITQHLQQLEGVDVVQELLHRVPTLRRVPWKLRPFVRQAFVSALVLARPGGGPQGGMTNGEKLARLVARMILALPPRPDAPDENETPAEREERTAREKRELQEHVRGRLYRFATGDWLALLVDARAAWPAQRSVRRGEGDPDDDVGGEAQRAEMANRACEAARDGRIARARQVLCSTGMLPGTDETRRSVEKLLRPMGREPPELQWIERGRAHAMGLDRKLLAKRIREMGKGGAADMAGWYAEHFQLLLGEKDDFAILHEYLENITRCRMSSGFYDTQSLGRVAPARKGLKNKVRPLVVGDLARKTCESTVCETKKPHLLQCLAPEQHAVGLTAAIEKYAKSVMCLVEATEDVAVGLLDCVSAYNHIERTPILEEVAEDCGDLLAFAATFLCRKGVYVFYDDSGLAHLIESADGVEQGAAISPALFALGMRRALRRIRVRLEALLERMREQGQQRRADAIVRLLSYRPP